HRARGGAHGHRGRSARLGQRRAHRRRAGCPGDHHRCRPPRPGHGPAGHRGPGPAPRRVARRDRDPGAAQRPAQPAAHRGGSGGGLSPALARAVAEVPGVATVSGPLKGQALVGGRSADVTAVIPATIGQVLDLHPVAGSIGRLAPDQIAVSRVEADDRGWHLGSRTSLVLPDGTRAWVTVGAIYTSRNLAGDTVLPIKLWAPHALQLTA